MQTSNLCLGTCNSTCYNIDLHQANELLYLFSLQLVFSKEPNISHLRIFECPVYVPISLSQSTKMCPQRRMRIYVGYESLSIANYLEPTTGDLFPSRFANCHFDKSIFPKLRGENKKLEKEISWNEL